MTPKLWCSVVAAQADLGSRDMPATVGSCLAGAANG